MEKPEPLRKQEKKQQSLNFRDLGLVNEDIDSLAKVAAEIGSYKTEAVKSISFSYNPLLKDAGAIVLIKCLPLSLNELGMVSCGMKDAGGHALLNWMKRATNLKMVCAEQNAFSEALKSEFHAFDKANPKVYVEV